MQLLRLTIHTIKRANVHTQQPLIQRDFIGDQQFAASSAMYRFQYTSSTSVRLGAPENGDFQTAPFSGCFGNCDFLRIEVSVFSQIDEAFPVHPPRFWCYFTSSGRKLSMYETPANLSILTFPTAPNRAARTENPLRDSRRGILSFIWA